MSDNSLPPISQEEITHINVYGAKEHNLKNIDVHIPRNQFIVITGLSGSGKSSLAFDTIFAEGQRRYMESFGAYARQFLGNMERPNVEKISGLSPVISIEQKTTNRNPRSTVGTTTEIYDFLRLLYARIGEAYSYNTGEKMVRFSEEQIIEDILHKFQDKKIAILAPLVRGRKGHYRELFEDIRKQGYLRVRVDGETQEIQAKMQVDRYKIHDIEVVIDRIKTPKNKHSSEQTSADMQRLRESINKALKEGKGLLFIEDLESGKVATYSKTLMCTTTGISYEEPSPNTFSFNSPYGSCPTCKGLGVIKTADYSKVIPDDTKSILEQGIAPLGEYRNTYTYKIVEQILKQFKYTLKTPIRDLSEDCLSVLLYGTEEKFKIEAKENPARKSSNTHWSLSFDGVINQINKSFTETSSDGLRNWAENYISEVNCSECNGTRLKKDSLWFKLDNKNIAEIASYDLNELDAWINQLDKKLTKNQNIIAKDIIKELQDRIGFLLNVGLNYLHLNRATASLSGGESQRIRLATQIGSQLQGITYILDEPSIGLHQRDNQRLILALRNLTEIGNTVIVVEHDKDIMLAADYILDLGPKAGAHGGEVVAQGTPKEFLKLSATTAKYLSNKIAIEIPAHRRSGNGKTIKLIGAKGNNLKNVTLEIPLGTFTCISGVSGSGKSTLINETLYPILNQYLYRSPFNPMPYTAIEGIENIDKVIEIDQSPIGRTPRSNPATYIGVFDKIRELYANIPESKIRGYKNGRFSFNVIGGRCEECQGGGMKLIEMNFLPDVYVQCPKCLGRRYNRETLEIKYKGKSIYDILEMSIEEAVHFFEHIPSIYNKIKTLNDVGLGYVRLGQAATTLSGGEAQRVKLSEELSKRDTGKTFYILDEPTTGLHFEDIHVLLNVLQKLVDKGNTIVVIEHNLDVIKVADHIVDLGPEGGRGGGEIIATGTPEMIVKNKKSITGQFLKDEL
ncbi:MAG TPA: excinuclease ABC subunit UvrA [Chitinophagales bacterium]|nr:excinuclease ABC subunit UvrA [Chitinophagales bacterium]HMW13325.1 excinuclease ABC subunit UvrA [Chitinophagales bacterium]HMX60500.1 excinuclease ABC subunit UvrA [Chitinophagales bacterium]HMZ33306.1 excinuclease ABC subunit UvrA [Chitinophagales bacterium]HNB48142.1 excinuclease ABC subunit UvrA [Chitinophagales bacterium]